MMNAQVSSVIMGDLEHFLSEDKGNTQTVTVKSMVSEIEETGLTVDPELLKRSYCILRVLLKIREELGVYLTEVPVCGQVLDDRV